MPLQAFRSAAHVTVDAKSLAVGDGGNEVTLGRDKSWGESWEVHLLFYDMIYRYVQILTDTYRYIQYIYIYIYE